MKKLMLSAVVFPTVIVGSATAASGGPSVPELPVTSFEQQPLALGDTFTVMTLNMAHGRANGSHQVFTARDEHEANLQTISQLIEREGPDVVAMQEADGPSWWSGRIDHVGFVARTAGFAQAIRGEHMQGVDLGYGTALIARAELDNASSHTFAPTPPTPSKGMVVATVMAGDTPVDVISVHLDFLREASRARQLTELTGLVKQRGRPVVIMGDFNMGWEAQAMQELVSELDLHTWQPQAELVTFPEFGSRLDWVLVSSELELVDHAILEEEVSDHRAVKATLRLAPQG